MRAKHSMTLTDTFIIFYTHSIRTSTEKKKKKKKKWPAHRTKCIEYHREENVAPVKI